MGLTGHLRGDKVQSRDKSRHGGNNLSGPHGSVDLNGACGIRTMQWPFNIQSIKVTAKSLMSGCTFG